MTTPTPTEIHTVRAVLDLPPPCVLHYVGEENIYLRDGDGGIHYFKADGREIEGRELIALLASTPTCPLAAALAVAERDLAATAAEVTRREPVDYRPARECSPDLLLLVARADGLRAQIASLQTARALGAGAATPDSHPDCWLRWATERRRVMRRARRWLALTGLSVADLYERADRAARGYAGSDPCYGSGFQAGESESYGSVQGDGPKGWDDRRLRAWGDFLIDLGQPRQ